MNMKNPELKELAKERALPVDVESLKRQELIDHLKAYDSHHEAVGEVKDEAKEHRRRMHGKVKMLVHPSPGDGGERPVFVSFNGHDYHVPRDQEVIVPYGVFEVFKNARSGKIETDERGNIKQRNTLRFPFTVLEMGDI
jgi:hypothetical protein